MSADELADRRRRHRRPLRIVEPPLPLPSPYDAPRGASAAQVAALDPTDDELDTDPELVAQVEELPLGWGEEPDR